MPRKSRRIPGHPWHDIRRKTEADMNGWTRVACVAVVLGASCCGARAQRTDTERMARDIFKQLIEINTTDSTGSVTAAAEAMAARLRAAGFDPKDVIVDG